MAKTSFYSGSGADSNDVSALENLKNQAQTSATAAAASASSAAASVASLNEDVATQSTKGLMSAADKTKLDGVESSADVTDTANVTAAGALMDSEVTSLSGIKTLTVPDSTTVSTFGASLVDDADAAAARTTLGLGTAATTASTAYATAAQGTTADAALPKAGGTMTGAITFASGQTFDGRDVSADGTKLDTIETNADVTDATNVQAAGALMDSELTSEASVKAINQGVATTDSPTFAGLTTTADVSFGDNDKAIFGAGSDLQIYHDGSNSYISDQGTGNLRVLATNFNVKDATGTRDLFYAQDGGLTKIYYNGLDRIETTSTGVDITGTLTSDGLTVDGLAKIQGVSTGLLINETDTTDVNSYLTTSGGVLKIFTTNDAFSSFTERMRVNHATGDISFYEDTGTTAKFFWDASAERLGIGTSSPVRTAEIVGGSAGSETILLQLRSNSTDDNTASTLRFGNSTAAATATGSSEISGIRTSTGSALEFRTQSGASLSTAMRIDSSGNVGIGTTSPSDYDANGDNLVIGTTSGNNGISIASGTTGLGSIFFADATSGAGLYTGLIQYNHSSNYMRFFTASSEAMRIDSSGNLLIAGTGTPTSSVGNLVLYNGTAPTGNATDGVILYAEDVSSSSELKVRDEAGNVTTLSPHNFDLIPEGPSEDMAWSYYSERDGKRINVDMLKAVRLLEQLTGEKLVHIV